MPSYNTDICSKLHVKLLEDFIISARTDRNNLICSIVGNDKKQPSYEDEENIIEDRIITKNTRTKALESLGATFNFVDI